MPLPLAAKIALGILIPVIVLSALAAFFGRWYVVASRKYTDKILEPGETYTVGTRKYRFPKLPIKAGAAAVLKAEFLLSQRELLVDMTQLLDKVNVPHWCSGGTLLGFVRHGTFMPWDDDIDLHVSWIHREYLWSPEFASAAAEKGLEVFTLKGASLDFATKEGAAIRLRRKGTYTPVCDVFFVAVKGPSQVAKVDSWRNQGKKGKFSTKEVWHTDDLFPVQTKHVDGLQLPMPHHPEKLLQRQYGENVLREIYARPVLLSHQTVFESLNWVWKIHRPG